MDPTVSDEKLWTEKYRINYAMIPSFLSNEIAHKILLTGKAVNFIRRCCHEQDWILDATLQIPFNVANWVTDHSNFADVTKGKYSWVEHAYSVTNKQLLHFLFKKFRFLEHCDSIRKYLLLGQGDFLQYLMDLLANELQKPAYQLYKHTLLGFLETANRASNAQYHDPEFYNRLDIKLLEHSPGDNGWDVFSLDYNVDAPLNTILTPEVMKGYLKIFNLLWRLKRVDHSLSQTWS